VNLNNPLIYPLGERPNDAELREVRPGIFWVRMPIPIAGLDFINLWLLADGDGWTIVDAGLGTRRVMEIWQEIFARHLGGKPVKRLICTHFHPDHLGQAGWLVERWNCEFWMTLGEWTFGRMLWLDAPGEVPPDVIQFYRRLGFDEAKLDLLRQRGFGNFRRAVREIPRSIRRIADGDSFPIGQHQWRVIVGRGHAPEHACLYSDELNLLISGDMVLPRISPHIGVYPGEPEADPLRQYLTSLPRFNELPADALVLPSHNEPFTGLHERVAALHAHHAERLDRLAAGLAEPKTAIEAMPSLFRRALLGDNMFMAISETAAHLHYLMGEGRVSRGLAADGAYRYMAASSRLG
jgi:glyoxylase-like metal-dependent hydrolase (beta-lactamase superfamily II)